MTQIQAIPAQTFIEVMLCDCGGQMTATGMARTTDPIQHEHQCSACGEKAYTTEAYPRTVAHIITAPNEAGAGGEPLDTDAAPTELAEGAREGSGVGKPPVEDAVELPAEQGEGGEG